VSSAFGKFTQMYAAFAVTNVNKSCVHESTE